jgi:calcineurin-like phosphoesterase family protein
LNVAEWNVHGQVHDNKLKEYPFLNRKTRKINVEVDLAKFYPVNLDG